MDDKIVKEDTIELSDTSYNVIPALQPEVTRSTWQKFNVFRSKVENVFRSKFYYYIDFFITVAIVILSLVIGQLTDEARKNASQQKAYEGAVLALAIILFILVIYLVIVLILKIFFYGKSFFLSENNHLHMGNIFDGLIILAEFGIDIFAMNSLRSNGLFPLFGTIIVVRILTMIAQVKALHQITRNVFIWSRFLPLLMIVLFLIVIMYTFSLFSYVLYSPVIMQTANNVTNCPNCSVYFPTLAKSFLSIASMVATSSFVEVSSDLADQAAPKGFTYFFFVVGWLVINIATLNVITAVIVNNVLETSAEAKTDPKTLKITPGLIKEKAMSAVKFLADRHDPVHEEIDTNAEKIDLLVKNVAALMEKVEQLTARLDRADRVFTVSDVI